MNGLKKQKKIKKEKADSSTFQIPFSLREIVGNQTIAKINNYTHQKE